MPAPFTRRTKAISHSKLEGRNSGTHTGAQQFAIDFGVPRGTEVIAAMSGIVVDVVSNQPDRAIGSRGASASDNIVHNRHDDGSYGIYGHLQQDHVTATVGQRVPQGALIGLSGNSGDTNGVTSISASRSLR